MSETRLFAADLGASGGKCFAGILDGETFDMREVHRFAHDGMSFHIADSRGDLTERTYWDDVYIHRNIVEGLRHYRREIGDTLDSIGIDTWGADGQFMTADGDMLGKVYCYRDHRLDSMVEAVKARMDARRMYAITGIHFQPFNVSNQLHWAALNRPEWLRPGRFYLPVPSLFYYYLCGSRKVDSTWASVTQLMDARRRIWHREILAALGIPRRVMPEIVAPGATLGELHAPLAATLGLNRARLIAVGSHDTASAFAAAPVARASEALIISSGTWSLVGKLVPRPILTEAAMAINLSNEGGIGNVRAIKNCMGTWLAQELRRGWRARDGHETGWDELVSMAAQAPAFVSLLDPDDPGFYNPTNMEDAIRAFCSRTGQPIPADRGAVVRAVYESLAFKYRLVNDQICDVTDGTTRVVHIVGGGSRNEMLNQAAADALGLPVLAGPEEATAIGNLMVQALGLGLIRSMREAQPIIRRAFPIRVYEPRDPEAWNRHYDRFRRLCGEKGASPS